jgi:hypothetical protein
VPRRLVDQVIVEPGWISALLQERYPGTEVTSLQVRGEDAGSASRLRLELTYTPATDQSLPTRMFLKRNLSEMSFPTEMYSTEVRFYRDVLPHLEIEGPALFAVESDDDDVRFTLLMEDLSLRRGARLGIATAPATPAEVASVLHTLATIHAAYWGGERLDRELPWLCPPPTNPQMRFWADVGPQLTRRHLERGHRAGLVDPDVWPPEEIWRAFEALLDINALAPHTLLHGDVHAGNVYYVEGSPGGLIDWQLMLRGSWALDVTYLIVSALTPLTRASHERSLLQGYLDRLRSLGVEAPRFDEAWECYRQNVLYGIIMWLITPQGVHSDAVQSTSLIRCLIAGEELRTLAALRG